MKYEITIIRVEEKKTTRHGEHTVIAEVPWTTDDGEFNSGFQSKEGFLKDNPLRKVYGYAPNWEGVTEETTEILKQVVEGLDIDAVIRAINNLE